MAESNVSLNIGSGFMNSQIMGLTLFVLNAKSE